MSTKDDEGSLYHFSQETSMHGVKYLFTSGWFRRILWLVLMLCATLLLARQIRSQMLQLQNNPVSTNVKLTYEPQMRFPAITICNGNQLRISSIGPVFDAFATMDLLNSIVINAEKLNDYIDTDFAILAKNNFQINPGATEKVNQLKIFESGNLMDLGNMDSAYLDSRLFAHSVSHEAQRMIINCYTNLGEICTPVSLINDFGVCQSINHNYSTVATAKIPGFSEKFVISLNVEIYESMPGKFPYAGFKLLLHDQSEWPLVESRALNIAAGGVTMLAIKRKEAELLPINDFGVHGSCINPFPLEYFPENQFNFDTCIQDNQLRMIARACGCTPYMVPQGPEYPDRNSKNICSVSKHFLCVLPLTLARGNTTSLFRLHPWMPELQEERTMCYESCRRIKYDAIMTQLALGESFVHQISPEAKDNITANYEVAMEASSRHKPDHVQADQKLLSDIAWNLEQVKELGIAPVPPENYSDTRSQLKNSQQCYEKLATNPVIQLLVESSNNGAEDSLVSDSTARQMIFKEAFLSAIMPNDAVNTLLRAKNNISNMSSIARNIREHSTSLLSLFGDLNKLSGIDAEFVLNSEGFQKVSEYISLYESGEITKQQWAKRHVSTAIGTGVDYRSGVWSPLVKNMRSIQNMIGGMVEEDFGNISEFLGGSEQLWRYVHYNFVMTHPTALLSLVDSKGNCTPQVIDDIISNFDLLMLNDSFIPGYKSPDCLLDQWSSFDLRNVLFDAFACLQVCNKSLTSLTAAVTHVSTPLVGNMTLLDDNLKKYLQLFTNDAHIFKNNLAQVAIYYQDMTREILLQQNTYDIWGLFCDIGGTLGLFLGASVMTFCEFIDWIVMHVIVKKTLSKRKPSKVQRTKSPSTGNSSVNQSPDNLPDSTV